MGGGAIRRRRPVLSVSVGLMALADVQQPYTAVIRVCEVASGAVTWSVPTRIA